MTALRDPVTDAYIGIVCDGNTAGDPCPTKAPRDAETLKDGGLIGLGWWCKGGKHLCPIHAHQGEPAE